jgi:hypothetical protein
MRTLLPNGNAQRLCHLFAHVTEGHHGLKVRLV